MSVNNLLRLLFVSGNDFDVPDLESLLLLILTPLANELTELLELSQSISELVVMFICERVVIVIRKQLASLDSIAEFIISCILMPDCISIWRMEGNLDDLLIACTIYDDGKSMLTTHQGGLLEIVRDAKLAYLNARSKTVLLCVVDAIGPKRLRFCLATQDCDLS